MKIQPNIQFGVLNQEQKDKIEEARVSSSGQKPPQVSVDDVFDQYLNPEPQPEVTTPDLPEMETDFVSAVIESLQNIKNMFLGPLPKETAQNFREQLDQTTSKLDEIPFTVPEILVDEIVEKYKTAYIS